LFINCITVYIEFRNFTKTNLSSLFIPNTNIKLKILFGILDWGLGHASRSIPVIDKYLADKHEITIASSGLSLNYLKERFPNLQFFDLKSKKLKYSSKNSIFTWLNISFRMLQNTLKDYFFIKKGGANDFELIISDNRYGFRHKRIKSIFISHQYRILVPKKFLLVQKIIWRISDFLIQQFDEFWIPDKNDEMNLAGALSQNCLLKNHQYIGLLSRFSSLKLENSQKFKEFEVLIIASGLEPQRSIFIQLLSNRLEILNKKTLIIGGFSQLNHKLSDNFKYYSHLDDENFALAVKNISTIICRSGYSTIMDLETLGKKAILIPTPNQSEQEYLADYLVNKGYTKCVQSEIQHLVMSPV